MKTTHFQEEKIKIYIFIQKNLKLQSNQKIYLKTDKKVESGDLGT